MPGGEHVAGVQADPGLRVPLDRGQVRCQVAGPRAQHLALPRHRLEQQVGIVVAELVEQREHDLAELPQRLLPVPGPAHRRPGVHHHAPGADLPAPPQRVRDRVGRLPRHRGVARAQVDQVRRVDEDRQPRSRSARSWSASPGPVAQPRGLDTNTWMTSAPTSAAYPSPPVASPPVTVACDPINGMWVRRNWPNPP